MNRIHGFHLVSFGVSISFKGGNRARMVQSWDLWFFVVWLCFAQLLQVVARLHVGMVPKSQSSMYGGRDMFGSST